jgi:hypothetical protein
MYRYITFFFFEVDHRDNQKITEKDPFCAKINFHELALYQKDKTSQGLRGILGHITGGLHDD